MNAANERTFGSFVGGIVFLRLQPGRRQPMISCYARSISAVATAKRCSDPQALTSMAVMLSPQSE